MSDKKFGLRIKWLGCACFEMDFGGATVVSDPWITANAKTECTWESVEKCDYITLSHAHYDHTLDIPALVNKFDSRVLCGEFTAMPLMRWLDLNPMSMYPMNPDLELDFDAVKIKALYGRHTVLPGGAAKRREWAENHAVNNGDPNMIEMAIWGDLEYRNYLYTMPNGTKILIWGNRLDRPEQRNQLLEIKPDIAILQMTKNSGADTAAVCKEMGCQIVIPHHFDFPGDYMSKVNDLQAEIAAQSLQVRCIVPEYGKWMEL